MARKEHYARFKELQAEKKFWLVRSYDAPCCRCESPCNGSIMRTSHKSTRARDYLAVPEIPRHPSGHGILLCHQCQRAVFFARGFLELVTRDLRREAADAQYRAKNPNGSPPPWALLERLASKTTA